MKKIFRPTFFIPIFISCCLFVSVLDCFAFSAMVSMQIFGATAHDIYVGILGYILLAFSPITLLFSLFFAIWHFRSFSKKHPRYRKLPLQFTCIMQGSVFLAFVIVVIQYLLKCTALIL